MFIKALPIIVLKKSENKNDNNNECLPLLSAPMFLRHCARNFTGIIPF